MNETFVERSCLCSICNKPSNDPQCFLCGHGFCRQCITPMIEENHTSCPTCQQSVSIEDFPAVDHTARQEINGLSVENDGNAQATLHSQNSSDLTNDASATANGDDLLSDVTYHQNQQHDQLSAALLFGPFKSLLSDLINHNRQLTEEIDQLKKQSQLQYQFLLDQFNEQSKKNAELQREIDQRHCLLEKNVESLRAMVKYLPDTKWKQAGITVARGNGDGDKLHQLCFPESIFIDDDQTIYIVDCHNHRIIEWKYNANTGRIVAGGNGKGNELNQLHYPKDVIIDKENNSLIIADQGNRRVMRYDRQNNTNEQIIISDIDCGGVTIDQNGSLYVSDCVKNEVRRWKKGQNDGAIVVAGGNGRGDHLNQLNYPTSIIVDENYSLYILDQNNHRVMKWLKGAKEGIVVAGGNGEGNRLTQLAFPGGFIVDRLGQIYVADYGNHRVMRWCKGYKEGTIVVGGNGQGQQSNQFNRPIGLSFDHQGNLYVVDCYNDRIQKFEID